MAQLFKPSANSAARASLFGLALAPWLIFYAGSTISRSPANTKENVPLEQPVPFSHLHHAYELGIDCRYCHVGVEKSKTSSVPATEVCMSCHSQIWTNSPLLEPVRRSWETGTPVTWDTGEVGWNKVNDLPEFVYFDHSIHLSRGINCNQCHGPVQKMALTWKHRPFSMAWCLECHREPEKYLFWDDDYDFNEISPQDMAVLPYRLYQAHTELEPYQEALMHGVTYSPTEEEIAKGKDLIIRYGVKKDQLTDCWICHR